MLSVFGTRPEAVKMCPLILELQRREETEAVTVLSGQHRSMLDSVMMEFGVKADYDLSVMKPSQTPSSVASDVLRLLDPVLVKEAPDMVLVHGDTTTSLSAALAAFHRMIPVGHVEAGLRTYNKYSPFPEEMNRTLTSRIAALHFAPTEENRKNLAAEGITDGITVTGNTVIDTFAYTVRADYRFHSESLAALDLADGRYVTVTAHRRENQSGGIENVCRAIISLTEKYPDMRVVYPVHLSPQVQNTVYPLLSGRRHVTLTEPLELCDMHNLIARSHLVLTDSGGLQEEAPSLGTPVLLLRSNTERPEAVSAGTVKLIGTDTNDVIGAVSEIWESPEAYESMAKSVNPYGDGHASERIADAIISYFNT